MSLEEPIHELSDAATERLTKLAACERPKVRSNQDVDAILELRRFGLIDADGQISAKGKKAARNGEA